MGDKYDYVTENTFLTKWATSKMATQVAAGVFGGFKVLQPLNLCFAGSFTVLIRYGISPSKIGYFIGDAGACKKFWTIVGDLLAIGSGLIPPVSVDSNKKDIVPPIINAVTTVLLLLNQMRLFYVCLRYSGYDGVRKYFFWLCLSGFINQADSVVAVRTAGLNGAFYFLAMELYTIFLPVLFWLVSVIAKCLGYDVEYCKLLWQLISIVFLTFASLCLWIAQAVNAGNDTSNTQDSQKVAETLKGAASPWFMGFIGMGMIFWLFPAIWPFMVCHYSCFKFVMLFAPILGCIATSIVWVISEYNMGRFDQNQKKYLHFHGWAGITGLSADNGARWNFTWLFVLGSVILFPIIISCVHNPTGSVARCILHSGWVVFIGSLFFFCSTSVKAFGLNGCAANIYGVVVLVENAASTDKHASKIQTLFNASCFGISLITMTISLFTTQAYSVGIGSFKCGVDSGCSWPTQGLGGFRSFWFWLGYGLRYGTKRFRGLWRIDIVSVIS